MPILETKNLEKILNTAKINRQYLQETPNDETSDQEREYIKNIKVQNRNFSEL